MVFKKGQSPQNFEDISGMKFSKLTVIERVENSKDGKSAWKCICDCGKEVISTAGNLKRGKVTSCGGSRIKDLTNKRFGRLVVLEKSDKPKDVKTHSQYWLCRCDCGNEKSISSHSLISGNTLSCGCYNQEMIKKLKYPENINMVNINRLFDCYKRSARERNLVFEITKDKFRDLIESPCNYCGEKDSNVSKVGNKEYLYNGIDRIDSSIGYVINNVVPCCCDCNRAKLSMSREKFLNWVKRVYKYSIEEKI